MANLIPEKPPTPETQGLLLLLGGGAAILGIMAAMNRQPAACPAGQVRDPNTGLCITPPPCPTGQVRDPTTHLCVTPPCQTGLVRDPATGLCIPPPGPVPIANGTLVTYDGSGGAVWIIDGGKRRAIVMLHTPGDVFAACGYNLNAIQSFPQAQVLAMPAGADVVGPPDCPYGNPPPPVRVIPAGTIVGAPDGSGRVWVIV